MIIQFRGMHHGMNMEMHFIEALFNPAVCAFLEAMILRPAGNAAERSQSDMIAAMP